MAAHLFITADKYDLFNVCFILAFLCDLNRGELNGANSIFMSIYMKRHGYHIAISGILWYFRLFGG